MNTELATQQEGTVAKAQQTDVAMTFDRILEMGTIFAQSGMFGLKTPAQAQTLMFLAHGLGIHPAIAPMHYQIIFGMPAKKTEVAYAEFLRMGGKMVMHQYTDEAVEATYTYQGNTVTILWDMKRAMQAGLPQKNAKYREQPRTMFRSRCNSEGIRTVCPGAFNGIYSVEEVEDIHFERVGGDGSATQGAAPASSAEAAPGAPSTTESSGDRPPPPARKAGAGRRGAATTHAGKAEPANNVVDGEATDVTTTTTTAAGDDAKPEPTPAPEPKPEPEPEPAKAPAPAANAEPPRVINEAELEDQQELKRLRVIVTASKAHPSNAEILVIGVEGEFTGRVMLDGERGKDLIADGANLEIDILGRKQKSGKVLAFVQKVARWEEF